MLEFYNYKTAILYLFICCMGEGFYSVMCKCGNIQRSNLKHKISEMKKGDKSAYREISHILLNCIRAFTEGEISDEACTYCQKNASDKYHYTFSVLFDKFKWACDENENFFYENLCDVLSNIISSLFFIDSKEKICLDLNTTERNEILKDIKNKNRKRDFIYASRPEYRFSLFDVRRNAKKTFYKWPIDEFYKHIGNEKANEIIKNVFGENDGSISTTFEKFKYETGKREWNTFAPLFKNELNIKNNKELTKILCDKKVLEQYQIFQSRMSAAFFLENLCAELPKFVDGSGKINSSEIRKIITLDESCKKPQDFLIPNHKEKTESYKEKVIDLLHANYSLEKITEKMDELDENCPATETIKAYIYLLNTRLNFYLSYEDLHSEDFQKYLEICKKNPRYLECFANMGISISNSKYSISSDLNDFLWRHENPILI